MARPATAPKYGSIIIGILVAVIATSPLEAQSKGNVISRLHLLEQVQANLESGVPSGVRVYAVSSSSLRLEQELLVMKEAGASSDNVLATDVVGPFVFITYPYNNPAFILIYTWQTGLLSEAIPFNPANSATINNAHGYSAVGTNEVCALWPLGKVTPVWNFNTRAWEGGSSTLASVCDAPGSQAKVKFDDWGDSKYPLWPGDDVESNLDTQFLLHRVGDKVVPAASGAPEIVIATIPPFLASVNTTRVIEVAAANESYLLLRSTDTVGTSTLYALNRKSNTWSLIPKSTGLSYRLFSKLLVASATECSILNRDKSLSLCRGRTVSVQDLESGETYPLSGGDDSEVIDAELDGTIFYREGLELYSERFGKEMSTGRKYLLRDARMVNVHWAFYR